jgi:hypothetical protein
MTGDAASKDISQKGLILSNKLKDRINKTLEDFVKTKTYTW